MFFGGMPGGFPGMGGDGFPGGFPGGMGGRGGPKKPVDTEGYYKLLGVEKNATAAEIKKA